ncbi:spore cortex biosynthesis protein YabQ [Tepidibacter mesophilus]|uniref:spore cortex biosynthesis protein YabQ n=1 Tax=Tepidibacter mesophilus TaxID=655607 RepID=UPI000C089C39|nr:spore cortex biosynthesis protein YabQ [Tepidibacter mesophilus]
MYPSEEIYILFVTVYGGILMGIIYDFYRGIRCNINNNKIIRCIEDILFWVIITIISFLILHRANSYDLRYYNFTGFIVGVIIYFNTVSKYILKFLCKLIKTIISIITNLYYLIIYPIHFAFDVIMYIGFKQFKKR